jgi:hypothetical protein
MHLPVLFFSIYTNTISVTSEWNFLPNPCYGRPYKIGWEGVDWFHLALDKDQCQAFIDAVTFGFHKSQRIFLTS